MAHARSKLLALLPIAALLACSPPEAGDDTARAHETASAPEQALESAPEGVSASVGEIDVRGAWAAATPGGVENAAAYLTIRNNGQTDDMVLSATSPRARAVEIHEMSMSMPEGMMQMRPMGALPLPAGQDTTLAPGATHLMFIDIDAPFAPGETVPVTLEFAQGEAITLELPVSAQPAAANADHGKH